MTPEVFISQVGELAQASMKDTGIPASFSIAEGALESGWGESQLYKQAFNLFGVKADLGWHGEVLSMWTREVVRGDWIKVLAKWRKYPSVKECFDDHAKFFHANPRYHEALGKLPDVTAFVQGIAQAGYSTDPDYAEKLLSIIEDHHLTNFDKGAENGHAAGVA